MFAFFLLFPKAKRKTSNKACQGERDTCREGSRLRGNRYNIMKEKDDITNVIDKIFYIYKN